MRKCHIICWVYLDYFFQHTKTSFRENVEITHWHKRIRNANKHINCKNYNDINVSSVYENWFYRAVYFGRPRICLEGKKPFEISSSSIVQKYNKLRKAYVYKCAFLWGNRMMCKRNDSFERYLFCGWQCLYIVSCTIETFQLKTEWKFEFQHLEKWKVLWFVSVWNVNVKFDWMLSHDIEYL